VLLKLIELLISECFSNVSEMYNMLNVYCQVEVEMEPDEKTVGESSLQEILSLIDEEEVVLSWKDTNSWKYIRELASDDADESKEVLTYYRSVRHCQLLADLSCHISDCRIIRGLHFPCVFFSFFLSLLWAEVQPVFYSGSTIQIVSYKTNRLIQNQHIDLQVTH